MTHTIPFPPIANLIPEAVDIAAVAEINEAETALLNNPASPVRDDDLDEVLYGLGVVLRFIGSLVTGTASIGLSITHGVIGEGPELLVGQAVNSVAGIATCVKMSYIQAEVADGIAVWVFVLFMNILSLLSVLEDLAGIGSPNKGGEFNDGENINSIDILEMLKMPIQMIMPGPVLRQNFIDTKTKSNRPVS